LPWWIELAIVVNTPDLSRTLFIQFCKIGDSLILSPLFEGIKRSSPGCRVYVVASVEAAEVFRGNPFVDGLAITRLDPGNSRSDQLRYIAFVRRQARQWGITTVICDVVNSWRWSAVMLQLLPVRHRVFGRAVKAQRFLCHAFIHANADTDTRYSREHSVLEYNLRILEQIGCRTAGLRVQVYPSSEERQRAHALIESFGLLPGRRTISFAPYSSKQSSSWPTSQIVDFVDRAAERYNILVFGAPSEGARWGQDVGAPRRGVYTAFGLNLREASVAIGRTDLLVALNSGTSHLFQTLTIPMLRLNAQHSPPRLWGYEGDPRYHSIEYPVPCGPCQLFNCPKVGHPCMSNITAGAVLDRIDHILGATIVRPPTGGSQEALASPPVPLGPRELPR
jgi:ADP-heptose:LPS heptosyltransferase